MRKVRGFCTSHLFQYWDLNRNSLHPPLLRFMYIIQNVLTAFGRTQLTSEQTFLINIHSFKSASSMLNYCLHLFHMLSMVSLEYFSKFLILVDVYSVVPGKKRYIHVKIYIYIFRNPAVAPGKDSSYRYPSGGVYSFLVANEYDEYILSSKMTVTSSCQGNTQNSINRCQLQENCLTHWTFGFCRVDSSYLFKHF